MLSYDYECASCYLIFEVQQGIKEKPLTKCPHCDGTIERVLLAAPFGFVKGEPRTIGQLADRNTKKMGKYELEAKKKAHKDAKEAAKLEALKRKMPEGSKIIKEPWYGSAPQKLAKATEAQKQRYIRTGDI